MIASAVLDVMVLSAVRSSGDGGEAFVLRLATSAALLLAGVAVAFLLYFLHHITQSLRVDVIIRSISQQTVRQVSAGGPGRKEIPDEAPPDPPEDAYAGTASRDGCLQLVDEQVLVDVARRQGHRVRIRPNLGEWVSTGATLAWAWPDGSGTTGDRDELRTGLHRGLHLGADRTESADLAEQVADSADRAACVTDQLERLVEQADLDDATDRANVEQAAQVVRVTIRQGTRPGAAPVAS